MMPHFSGCKQEGNSTVVFSFSTEELLDTVFRTVRNTEAPQENISWKYRRYN